MARKILIHSIVFSPDGVSTAYLYNDIALRFKEEGHEVVVLTTTPQYNIVESNLKNQQLRRKLFGLYYESSFHGIKVKHVPQKKFKSTILRIIGFVYWHIVSFLLALFERNINVILSPSPPLTIGFINIIIGKLKAAKVVYNVQEIYPDLLIRGKNLKNKPIIKTLQTLERFVYNKSDAVTTIDQIFADTIIDRIKKKSKLKIIPNFVDTDIYKPIPEYKQNIDETIFPESDSLKVMYAGNIGYAQDWKTLIELAKVLKGDNIEFYVIGTGVMSDYLKEEIKKNNLDKVHLLPYQPRNLIPSIVAYSDIQFVFMSKEMETDGFPSKVYTIMACERPLLVCSGAGTPIINFLEDLECSFLIKEKVLSEKVEKMANILRQTNKEQLSKMGKNGLDIIKSKYTKTIVTQKYVDLVNNL